MSNNALGLALVGLGTIISVLTQPVLPLIFLLVFVMACDYLTGIIKAAKQKELSSKKGLFGILKKTVLLLYLACGFTVDIVIYTILEHTGINFQLKVCFGFLIAIWLIINETISICENIIEITGVEVPFLKKILLRLKITTEKLAKEKEDEDE